MSLSQVTKETRGILKWLGIFLGAIILIFFLLKIKDIIFPAPPPPPTVGFGKLPPAEFPVNFIDKKLTYSVDTLSGSLPVFSTSQKVYKMEEAKPDLLSLTRAQEKAKAIGFEDKGVEVSDNVYQWKNSKENKTLTMNILNYNFNLSSDYLLNPSLPTFNKSTDDAVAAAKDILSKMDLLPKDIDDSRTKTDLLTIKNYKLTPASSLSNAEVIRVSFFQKPFNTLPLYYSSNSVSPMNFIIGSGLNGIQILEGNFFYQKPSESFSTYPIKTASDALKNLKEGYGYIASLPSGTKVSIKKISLGYYLSDKKQNYLLPVIVFEGDDFQAFVPAVTDEWVNK